MQVKLGITDRTVTVFIPDPASTDGSGKTGLTHADLTVSYTRVETDNDVAVTDVTSSLSTLTALTDAHTDWGVKEVSSTLAPGLYRLDIADAVFASGAWEAVVYVMITSSAAAASPIKFQLVAYDPLDAQLGMSARLLGTTTVTNLNTIFDTDYSSVYNTTAKCILAQLDDVVAHGGSEATLRLGSTSTVPLIIGNSGGDAVQITSSGGNGDGIQIAGNGSGNGIVSTGGATGDGIKAVGGATSGDGIDCSAATSGHGLNATGAGNGSGLRGVGAGTGGGLAATGGGSDGSGIIGTGGSTNGAGIVGLGFGSGSGMYALSAGTGVGFAIAGGGTSGDGVSITTTSGHGVNIAPVGTAKHGVQIAGGNGATADGINVAAGTGGVAVRVASHTVTGASTYTGVAAYAAGITVAQSSLNSAGILIAGNGTAAGIDVTGGATGDGITVAAGGGSGRALHLGSITVDGTSVLTGAVSMGSTFTVTGGIVANITGNITGNLVGTVSTLTTYTGNTPQTGDAYARLGAPAGASVSADVAAVKVDTAAILDDTGTSGVVVAAASKTGYALSSTGLDSVSTTAPSGVASNFREMVVQTWRRWFKKTHYDISNNTIKTYADNGTSVLTTQTTTVSATDEDVGAAT